MIREVIKIDEEKCDGCGLCVPTCHEGALQIIDNKAVLVSELMCDGLGACVGHCPLDALTIEKREAEPYDEEKVIQEMVSKGKNVVLAHLKHLEDHQQDEYLETGIDYLVANRDILNFDVEEITNNLNKFKSKAPQPEYTVEHEVQSICGCPGTAAMSIEKKEDGNIQGHFVPSQLSQWPVQMHLVNPNAPFFRDSDFVLAADCVAYAMGNFHGEFLKGKTLGIACPKLDSNKETYIEKLIHLIDDAQIRSLTVLIMEVPCCSGLLQIAKIAQANAQRIIPLKPVVVGISGEVKG